MPIYSSVRQLFLKVMRKIISAIASFILNTHLRLFRITINDDRVTAFFVGQKLVCVTSNRAETGLRLETLIE